jgi:RecB family exonuclease
MNNDPLVAVYLREHLITQAQHDELLELQKHPPKGCAYHSYSETCAHCGHPEYCPAYGWRVRNLPIIE